ncbi:hypothetical protein JOF58_000938 [Streptomyces cinnamonensis]|nr:hypothetical protein [Streptomyces virginiae]
MWIFEVATGNTPKGRGVFSPCPGTNTTWWMGVAPSKQCAAVATTFLPCAGTTVPAQNLYPSPDTKKNSPTWSRFSETDAATGAVASLSDPWVFCFATRAVCSSTGFALAIRSGVQNFSSAAADPTFDSGGLIGEGVLDGSPVGEGIPAAARTESRSIPDSGAAVALADTCGDGAAKAAMGIDTAITVAAVGNSPSSARRSPLVDRPKRISRPVTHPQEQETDSTPSERVGAYSRRGADPYTASPCWGCKFGR